MLTHLIALARRHMDHLLESWRSRCTRTSDANGVGGLPDGGGVGSAVAGPYFSGLLVAHRVLAVMLLVTLFAAGRHNHIVFLTPKTVYEIHNDLSMAFQSCPDGSADSLWPCEQAPH